MRRRTVASAVILSSVLAAGPPVAAQSYKWIDERGVAHYTQGLDSVPEAYRATATPLRDETPRRVTTIQFTPGSHIVVEARINGGGRARLILDTGAEVTVISPRALAAAGVSLTNAERAVIVGATGGAEVAYVPIDSLEVGDARVARMPVMSYHIAAMAEDGVIGRDFLNHFNITIDAAHGVVTLTPK